MEIGENFRVDCRVNCIGSFKETLCVVSTDNIGLFVIIII